MLSLSANFWGTLNEAEHIHSANCIIISICIQIIYYGRMPLSIVFFWPNKQCCPHSYLYRCIQLSRSQLRVFVCMRNSKQMRSWTWSRLCCTLFTFYVYYMWRQITWIRVHIMCLFDYIKDISLKSLIFCSYSIILVFCASNL